MPKLGTAKNQGGAVHSDARLSGGRGTRGHPRGTEET